MMKKNSLYNTPVKQINNFHEIEDIDERRAYLQKMFDENEDSTLTKPEIEYYLELMDNRYEKKGSQLVDKYMRSFMMLLTVGRASGIGFLSSRRKKEVQIYLKDLNLDEYKKLLSEAPEKAALQKEEWADFAACFISSCSSSKSYSSAFLGMIPMPDKNVAIKIAADIDSALRLVPASYGLEEEATPLYEVFTDTYKKLLENGEALFNEYLASLK